MILRLSPDNLGELVAEEAEDVALNSPQRQTWSNLLFEARKAEAARSNAERHERRRQSNICRSDTDSGDITSQSVQRTK